MKRSIPSEPAKTDTMIIIVGSVVQGVDQGELVIIEGEQTVLDGEYLRGAKELLVSGKEEVYFLTVHSVDVLYV